MKTLYSVIWGQFTELMRHRIQALPEYKKMYSNAKGNQKPGFQLSITKKPGTGIV